MCKEPCDSRRAPPKRWREANRVAVMTILVMSLRGVPMFYIGTTKQSAGG